MYLKKTCRMDYNSQSKRYSLNADPELDRLIKQTQTALAEELGQRVSFSYAAAYLIKRGYRTEGLHRAN